MADPLSQILGETRDFVTPTVRLASLPFQQGLAKFRAERLVAIHREDPIVRCLCSGEILLLCEVDKGFCEYSRGELSRDLARAVRAAGIHQHNFVGDAL